ncbi:DUF72 domain-containing protein [Microbacterium sp. M3]|uniref:DUF72 domain-containing protein n=1 Tax=Microbacterium arthrosphaerae TaxID=792652 RepID=A0ABU4GW94_9MICO|nr:MULTISPECIES: DUF72 domain-containing protein [Microbacterium]MDW4571336.1 DUF72 domain-containing protein [Microbacterium arthrosphaerae]MDW7605191.1 DUF72 domain-containing protein [Microbacterium sp. M3]
MARIGTSGWIYPHWRGVIYRGDQRTWLDQYTAEFDTVELNGSFYRWPADARYAAWRDRLPDGFEMAVKASRGLTHARRLRDPEVWIERITRGLHALDGKRGPLIVQLHPSLERDDGLLDHFLTVLPDWTRPAIEFRHPSWHDEAVFAMLERHAAAYCVMSGAHLPCILRATTHLVYVRLHGPDTQHLYAGSYSDDDLRWWADRIGEWEAGGHEVFAYFNNDGEGNAVRNARTLKGMLQP